MKEWYGAKELAGLPGMPGTERGAQKKAQSEAWRFQDVPAKGGPGGKRREYHLASLPEATRMHLLMSLGLPGKPGAEPHLPDGRNGTAINDLTAFLDSRRIHLSPSQLADTTWQRRIACYRAFHSCPAYAGREALLSHLAAQYNVSKLTIRNWVKAVEGLQVKRAPRVTIGSEHVEIPRSSAFNQYALAFGLAFYANNMVAGVKTAYMAMRSHADEKGWQIGDYSNFTRIIKKLPSALFTRIKKGDIGAELHLLPKTIRQWTAIPVQSVLCGDQKIFDYIVHDPVLDEVVIPNGYFWMDCASRMINGVSMEPGHYNSFTVGAALRGALGYGIPKEIFTDWGKPELSKHVGQILKGLSGYADTSDFLAMQERFGDIESEAGPSTDVGHRKAQPGKPWTKPIENIMNLIDQRLKAKQVPGFRKRMKDAWENKTAQEELKKMIKGEKLMTIEDFYQTVFTVVDEHNKAEKKLKEGGKIVPYDFFSTGLRSQTPLVLPDCTLDYICLPTYQRRPQQSVVRLKIRGEERTYFSKVLSGRKEAVNVSVDPYDRDVPAVITDLNGAYLDSAEPWHVTNPYDTKEIARKRERQAELMKWIREQTRRLKEGFGVIETSIPKVSATTHTAKKAEKAKKAHELNKENARLIEAERNKEAETERLRMVAEWEEGQRAQEVVPIAHAPSARPAVFCVPSEGKDKYRLWLSINARIEAGDAISDEETQFHDYYGRSGDFRNNKLMHERFGDLYIDAPPAAASAGMTE